MVLVLSYFMPLLLFEVKRGIWNECLREINAIRSAPFYLLGVAWFPANNNYWFYDLQYVDPEFGTGVLKISPGHDHNDYHIARKLGLPILNVMNKDGTLNDVAGLYRYIFFFFSNSCVIYLLVWFFFLCNLFFLSILGHLWILWILATYRPIYAVSCGFNMPYI